MCSSNIGQHPNGRLYNRLQRLHFSHFRYTSLENAKLGMLVHHPYGQRNTYLWIIAARRAGDDFVRTQQLINPLFHDCLAITSRNTYHRHLILLTVLGCQTLQSLQRISYLQEVSIRIVRKIFRHIGYHKVPHSSGIKLRYIFVSVITFCLQSKKQCLFREAQRTTVGKNPVNRCRAIPCPFSSDDGGYFFNRVWHNAISFCTSKYGNFSFNLSIFNIIWLINV